MVGRPFAGKKKKVFFEETESFVKEDSL